MEEIALDAGGAPVTVSVEIPQDPGPGPAKATITVVDGETREAARDVVLLVGMSHGGRHVFSDEFAAPRGTLEIVLDGADPGAPLAIDGAREGGAWQGGGDPVRVSGSALGTPGLHTVHVELASSSSPAFRAGEGERQPAGRADLSIVEAAEWPAGGAPFHTRSYFDAIDGLSYDPEAGTVEFRMPFDWSADAVSHVPVVHVEVQFPKDFAEYVSPSYEGSVNGVGLFRSSVIMDDYTYEDKRTVHFVLLNDHLRHLGTQMAGRDAGQQPPDGMLFELSASDESQFPLTAYTAGEEFSVDLTWEPPEVEPGEETTFVFTIRDGRTGEPLRRSSYEFVILQGGQEVHRARGEATVGGSFERYTFGEGQEGPAAVRLEDIRGTGAAAEFGLVVVPEFGAAAAAVLAAAVAAAAVAGRRAPSGGRITG